ncbi:MAG: glycosyltransferase family 4 protein [Acidobacteriota bacterium]|nr:glycosyltransferase family 4 protein [Acidobacteriota bacterium]
MARLRARSPGGLVVKVALDVSAVPPRIAGAGRYVAEVAARLTPLGVETTLVTRRDDLDRWRTRAPQTTLAPLVPTNRVGRLLYEATRLGSSPVARQADIWHAPHYTMPRRASTPVVVTIHDLTFFTNPEWHERAKVIFFQRAIRYAAAHATELICVSAYTARQLHDVLAPSVPVSVAPLGVDHARFHPRDERDEGDLTRAGLATTTPFLLYVGTLEPRKGVDVLLRAFAELAREDAELELWIAGQAGWAVGPISEQLRTHPYANRVRRLGFVDEVVLPALFRRARVVVYPSRGEGFGLPVLEAMACGASVVTSRDTVMAEVAGDSAVLCRAGDANDLASALSGVLHEDRDVTTARQRAAAARAQGFTWEATMQTHLEVYERARRA